MHASLVLTPSNTTLFWPVFPYLIGNSSEVMILTVKCIQLEQLKMQTWKKFSLDQDQIYLFNCSSWNHLKTASPLWPHLLHQAVHTWFISYVSIFKKTEFPWQLELFLHQKYKCLKGCEQKSITLLTEGRDSLELLHCLILHYCIVHLVLLNSNYKFFTDT